ncbi:hypothetical protein O9K51_01890 [Purpureocillium lavendulum]|uniref:Uncharacterized protein n=1 Tax=Purpureocillium lavendulum TaxID=1247861 RepID=A0AB34G673_9HYPO|nr:hypothetical protein O9K51_01890 [Purpureocillium lavendulum]
MARTYKRWIYTKSCEFPPDGNFRLGQIIGEPTDPAYVLQPLGPLPLLEGMNVETTRRENVRLEDKDELSGQFKAWAKLGFLPARFSSSVAASRSDEYTWHFKSLESRLLSPSLAYVQDAMRHGDVPATLKTWLFKHRVYMVTGVRVVSGARMKRKDQTSMSASLAAEAPLDESVSAGATGNIASSSVESEGFEKATDFVFAYRLNEISYRGNVKHKPYTGGETESSDKAQGPRPSEIEIDDFEVLKISERPLAGSADDFDRVSIPGFEDVECFVPKG